jgi:hypothetical protein
VKANSGLTIPETAEKMGIKQNYLYRVLSDCPRTALSSRTAAGGSPRSAPNT